MTQSDILIVVSKRPTPGHTKTRLTPPLTSVQAAGLYECFLQDTLDIMRQVPEILRVVAFLPENERDYFSHLAPDFGLQLQEGSDLGARLDHALQQFLKTGNTHVVIMDSDSPTLPAAYLAAAFRALHAGSDVVLGPCEDGGYYCIGLNRPAPRLLREVHMSTPLVTQETLELAALQGLSVHLLPEWYDIDEIDTLRRLVVELENQPPAAASHTRAFLSNPEFRKQILMTDREYSTK